MEIKNLFIYVKNTITFKLSVFTQSILFYPLIFSIIIFIVYLVTSRLDHLLFDKEFRMTIPYLDSLFFAGSANAATSILSAIAGGWTTILGVTFSVTLVTLQLSTSKYTSHLIHKFENDRINKLTLGWFIAVVVYALLVLKTVRTDQAIGDIFTPIIGVNVAVLIALIGLFIFVLFLNNIGSYLKPKVLVSGIVDQIIRSIKPYEKRDIDKKSLYEIKEEKNNQHNIKKLYEIKSKQQGIVRYIDWNTIFSGLQNQSKNKNTEAITTTNIRIEFNKALGESVERGNILVIIYVVDNKNKENDEKEKNKQKTKVDNNKKVKNIPNDLQQILLSSFDINKDRDLSRDYAFGIELLRSLAIKSITQKDSDITNSCISGLFRILIYVLKRQEIFGLPFRIVSKKTIIEKKNNNNNKEDFNNKINKSTEGYNIENNNNKSNLIRKTLSASNENTEDNIILIKPKEKKLSHLILSDLSIINFKIFKEENIPVIKHFMNEYVFSSKTLLENDRKNEFILLTDWYSKILTYSIKSLNNVFLNEVIVIPISDFRNYISEKYPAMKNSFNIYMQNIINI